VTEREWSVAEIESLRVFGRIIGNAIFREQLDAERRQAEAFLETHLANLPAVTYIEFTDSEHELGYDETYVSPQVTDLLGYSVEEWFDHTVLDSIHPEDRPAVDEETERTARTGEPYYAEYRMRRKDGEWIWVRDQCNLIPGEPGMRPYWHGVMLDITEAKKLEEQIAFLAYHDTLTGLANRKLLAEMLEPALARAVRNDHAVAVLFMDLDNFKQINDTLGHDMGDLLLQQVTARLTEVTRETDLVARQGGDEFLIMMPDIESGGVGDALDGRERAVRVVELMAERIHKAMRLPFSLGDAEVETSMSIGISLFPFDATDVRSLLKNSDAAMYRSKKSHSGGYALFARTGKDPMVDLSFTNRLRQAVKDQPWVLHYQPMVSLESRQITGVEALLRWRKPKGDLLPADQFVPLAEEMGLLEIIGEWVLEELGRQMTTWAGLGLDLDVGFNLSPRQLWQPDLVSKLGSAFDSVGADRSRVIVEVSESTATTDPGRSQRVLWAIHEQGFKLAIDDFGTGYTSPARLKRVPVDILKIDHPLTRDLPDDEDVGGFVEAVIRFAENLGVVALAEGIETEAQREFLLDKGCKMGQGYLFSRPVSGDDIADLLR
jgi:diguanylate cyclase (GGDEF)-like protein/PAS domain S-box-containing protein